MNRRDFVLSIAAGAAVASTESALARPVAPLLDAKGARIPVGMDNFAVRALGLKGRALVDYAAGLRLDTLFITDLPALGTMSEDGCKDLAKAAADKGVQLLLGSWSICPTSKSFKKDWGTAEEHLATGLRLSRAAGSPFFRVVLGAREDRRTPGGIEARIADTVKVLRSQRSLAMDLGLKVAAYGASSASALREAWSLGVDEVQTDDPAAIPRP